MKIAIVGSRNFSDMKLVFDYVASLPKDTTVISGGARGVDTWARFAAKQNELHLEEYPANWGKYGKSAGYIRNKTIVDNCDKLIAFWDGKSKGTKHSIDLAREQNKLEKIIMGNGNEQTL